MVKNYLFKYKIQAVRHLGEKGYKVFNKCYFISKVLSKEVNFDKFQIITIFAMYFFQFSQN